ncbi:complement factor I isoform X2 [Pangasianodon hypophthalmus]|uniref:complement factor I isoform X2 n=1 Tax=Pangasianodon hypophthalmus TaxID=310915 RepID=UPI0023078D37|nr:complement factor I isoform X2 [Pangasianodon hypophthalmus]
MMRITLVLLLSVLLLQLGCTKFTDDVPSQDAVTEQHAKVHLEQVVEDPPVPDLPNTHREVQVDPEEDSAHESRRPLEPKPELNPPAPPPRRKDPPPKLLSEECVSEKHTRSSCAKVFCLPWQRCINGQCVCKLPYQCPRFGPAVCGLDGRRFLSLCQAQAIACRDKKPMFSHYLQLGECAEDSFKVELRELKGQKVVQVSTVKKTFLICGSDSWNMAAANVVCRHTEKDPRGALALRTSEFKDLVEGRGLTKVHKCMSVRCTGAEHTLAECVLYKPRLISDNTSVATVTCYTKQQAQEECDKFRCVNEKCVSLEHVCDGVDDCGDNSDEMCCTGCQKGAFYCKTGVCLPRYAVGDQIRDCLGGEDEHETSTHVSEVLPRSDSQTGRLLQEAVQKVVKPEKEIWSNPTEDIHKARNHTETLECGIPNLDYIHKTEEETQYRRTKRVVGGEEALPTQIQWQVAVQEDGKIHCGGAYLGGCWVLTAAHCVRQKPQAFRIKFSLWKKLSLLSTTDSVPVKNIIIHREYNPRTYQNDIALIQLEELAHQKECLTPNPAVRPVCVPWSTEQFPPGHTCTISGWGRNKQGDSVNILKWANVSLIPYCRSYYKERFFDGMMCAGDLEGNVDSCQGDSGGPLVCKDASGVSYVWGVVSWGEKCGEAGYPGVYTKVAHYFEWIRQHTGWQAVTKYNQ